MVAQVDTSAGACQYTEHDTRRFALLQRVRIPVNILF